MRCKNSLNNSVRSEILIENRSKIIWNPVRGEIEISSKFMSLLRSFGGVGEVRFLLRLFPYGEGEDIPAFAMMTIRLYFTSSFGVQYSMFDIQKKAVLARQPLVII